MLAWSIQRTVMIIHAKRLVVCACGNTGVFDYAIWVARSDHLPLEDKSSMRAAAIMPSLAPITIAHVAYVVHYLYLRALSDGTYSQAFNQYGVSAGVKK